MANTRPGISGDDDVLAELIALRLIVQRLYANFALSRRLDNVWLEKERDALQETLKSQRVELAGASTEKLQYIRGRVEFMINHMFDALRIDPNPPA